MSKTLRGSRDDLTASMIRLICSQYNIKKKEELPEPVQEEPANPLMRKKKTPEELAKEAEMEEEDEFTSKGNAMLCIYPFLLIRHITHAHNNIIIIIIYYNRSYAFIRATTRTR